MPSPRGDAPALIVLGLPFPLLSPCTLTLKLEPFLPTTVQLQGYAWFFYGYEATMHVLAGPNKSKVSSQLPSRAG